MAKVKTGSKLFAVVRALDQIEGVLDSGRPDVIDKYSVSMTWLDDRFKGYYMSWDPIRNYYVVEWRGHIIENGEKCWTKEYVVACNNGTLIRTAKVLLKGVRKYQKHLKEENVEFV